MKGIIVGFSENKVYVKTEQAKNQLSMMLKEFGIADVYRPQDVVVIGEIKILSGQTQGQTIDRTQKFRPIMMGISVGQRDITAGTLGGFAEKDGEHYIVSNAHVLHSYPVSNNPPQNKEIWQPGPIDTGYDYEHENDYVVGYYEKHVRVRSMYDYSDCPITRTINKLYEWFGRNSRAIVLQVANNVDLAIARVKEGIEIQNNTFGYIYGGIEDVNINKMAYIGNLFAGSENGHAVIVKSVKYWNEYFSGYSLMFPNVRTEVDIGEKICKDGRTSGATCGTVLDNKMSIVVNYGLDLAWFEDVILTDENMHAQGGDSGSATLVNQ
jgi:hypothetical protein